MQGCVASLKGYEVHELLGRGGYGVVCKARRVGSKLYDPPVAIKCIDRKVVLRTKSAEDGLINEIGLLKTLRHPHIVELLDFLWDDQYIYLVLEFCEGHDLSLMLSKYHTLPERLTQRFLRQLADALLFLRRYNISHFDLKPQNILLTAPPVKLKLADFGFARFLCSGDVASGYRGTPLYMAPEMMVHNKCTAESDLWSVGVILYECLFGKVPFSADSFAAMVSVIRSVRQVQLPYPQSRILSSDCIDLLGKLLRADPEQRIKFAEFFRHPFVGLKPCDASLTGRAKIRQAMEADEAGHWERAIKLYGEGVELILPYLRTLNGTGRDKIRSDLSKYLKRAEELKNLNTKRASLCENSTTEKPNTGILIRSSSGDPVVKACHLLAKAAEDLANRGEHRAAVDKYELVIMSAQELLSNDQTVKNEHLRECIEKWSSDRESCLQVVQKERDLEEKSGSSAISTKSLQEHDCRIQ